MNSEIRLAGFEHDNLLAFLALLGLLKVLDYSRPGWNAQASWDGVVPHLHLSHTTNKADMVDAVVEGIAHVGSLMQFEEKTLKLSPEKFQKLQEKTPHEIMASLGSDGALRKEHVQYPPLCMLLGAGHQYFLERLMKATNFSEDTAECVKEDVWNVLFEKWEYKDDSDIGFRWDHREYRPHAYRSRDPTKDRFLGVDGANRLAAVGFTNYWCVPANKGLETVSCEHGGGSTNKTFWPIWNKKLSLKSILTIMRHPLIKSMLHGNKKGVRKKLRSIGINYIMVAEIFWDGQYRNVTRGCEAGTLSKK